MSQLIKFEAADTQLRNIVRHYWSIQTTVGQRADLILPMDHVDLIIAPEDTFEYHAGNQIIVPEGIHFHGIRLHSVNVKILRKSHVWGISFQPWGFHLLLNLNMKELSDGIHPMDLYCPEINRELGEIFMCGRDLDGQRVRQLDQVLISAMKRSKAMNHHIPILRSFVEEQPENIRQFCTDAGISIRQLERVFNHCIGVSPKGFLQISRFEHSTREILYGNDNTELTGIAYRSGFYDQAHFIKEFKKYSAFTPRKFRVDAPAVKTKLFKLKSSQHPTKK